MPKPKRKSDESIKTANIKRQKIDPNDQPGSNPCKNCILCQSHPKFIQKTLCFSNSPKISLDDPTKDEINIIEKNISCYDHGIYLLNCRNCGQQNVGIARSRKTEGLKSFLWKFFGYFTGYLADFRRQPNRKYLSKKVPSEIRHLVDHYHLYHKDLLYSNSIKNLADMYSAIFIDKFDDDRSSSNSEFYNESKERITYWLNRVKPAILSKTFTAYSYHFQKDSSEPVVCKVENLNAKLEKRPIEEEEPTSIEEKLNNYHDKNLKIGTNSCKNCIICDYGNLTKRSMLNETSIIKSNKTNRLFTITNPSQKINCKNIGVFLYQCTHPFCQEQAVIKAKRSFHKHIESQRFQFKKHMRNLKTTNNEHRGFLSKHYLEYHADFLKEYGIELDLDQCYKVIYLEMIEGSFEEVEKMGKAKRTSLLNEMVVKWTERIQPEIKMTWTVKLDD